MLVAAPVNPLVVFDVSLSLLSYPYVIEATGALVGVVSVSLVSRCRLSYPNALLFPPAPYWMPASWDSLLYDSVSTVEVTASVTVFSRPAVS